MAQINEPRYGAMSRDFQSFAGPGDKGLPMTEVSGYQPVSRIGEIVMNAFVDSYEFAGVADQISAQDMTGDVYYLSAHRAHCGGYRDHQSSWVLAFNASDHNALWQPFHLQ